MAHVSSKAAATSLESRDTAWDILLYLEDISKSLYKVIINWILKNTCIFLCFHLEFDYTFSCFKLLLDAHSFWNYIITGSLFLFFSWTLEVEAVVKILVYLVSHGKKERNPLTQNDKIHWFWEFTYQYHFAKPSS